MGPFPHKNSEDPMDSSPNIPADIPTTRNSNPQSSLMRDSSGIGIVDNRGVKESILSANSGDEPPTLKSIQQGISLTKVSKMYDIDGDGKLDEAEQAMRDMDTSGRGYLANEKVYALMQDHLKMQREMFRFKKVIAGLVAFVAILSLCNLGSSFAAASLAKDTTTNSQKELVNSKTKEVISTQTTSESFEIERITEDEEGILSENEDGDERSLLTYNLSSYLSIAYSRGERMIRRCYYGNTVSVVRTWHDGTETSISVCPPKDGDYKQNANGRYVSVSLNNGIEIAKDDNDNYRIWGDTFTQDEGHVCDVKADCDTGLICPESDGVGRVCRYAREHEPCDGSNFLCDTGLECIGDNVCAISSTTTTTTTTGTTTTTTTTTTPTTTTSIEECNYMDAFSVPSTFDQEIEAYYFYIHMTENGPDLNVNIVGGISYFDSKFAFAVASVGYVYCEPSWISSVDSSFTLSGCGVSGLDGDYWITMQDDNLVWVEKNSGLYAVVFSNSDAAPEICGFNSPTTTTTTTTTTTPTMTTSTSIGRG